MALQEAAEAYLMSLFEDTNLAAIHVERPFIVLYPIRVIVHCPLLVGVTMHVIRTCTSIAVYH